MVNLVVRRSHGLDSTEKARLAEFEDREPPDSSPAPQIYRPLSDFPFFRPPDRVRN